MRTLTDEAPVGKDEPCTNPHTITEGPEPVPDHDEIVVGWLLRAINYIKASCFHFLFHDSLAGEAEC